MENASPLFKLSKKMVTVSQSKLNVLESLNPIIQKFNVINDYEINKKDGGSSKAIDTTNGNEREHSVEES